ncbi:DNA cytosine methyltransferase [Streptomyces flavotricini]|uniref:Cytosine-specific methyltransferase n=1 Tax=Streptomyces flavotricini TaxID=66888 RepID=A0ABS8EDV4_9ACTN|nr:DNA cytosine methyltransferase [Streptomyces flavotricini]MCC0098384.1 DNA cytosine methyltransferase [Streptomyces flavotricini]
MLRPSAIDLFAGAGGATRGLRDAGLGVLAAIENDPEAARTYRTNHPKVRLFEADIRTTEPVAVLAEVGLLPGQLDVLKACPPCQGFSTLAKGEVDEERNDLVLDVARFVKAMRPKVLLLENVPGLRRDARLPKLLEVLGSEGYLFKGDSLDATSFGVPQRRKRFILFGIRGDLRFSEKREILEFLPASFGRPRTVRHALGHLERYARDNDPLDVHRSSSPAVQRRIEAIPVGGNRFDLPDEHQLECHRKLTTRSASSSYGRVKLDEPAPTMTTRCTTPACGSFIHPTEHRGLTLREAATLQTFPVGYVFQGHYGSIERQIGNAVPVRMAKGLGLIALEILRNQVKPDDCLATSADTL